MRETQMEIMDEINCIFKELDKSLEYNTANACESTSQTTEDIP